MVIVNLQPPDREFGCEACWPESAEAAWEARRGLTSEAVLIEQSHYQVAIRACPRCHQQFVWVYTEMVDWVGGNDPFSCTLLPLTAQEAATLSARKESVINDELNCLGSDRRSLKRASVTGESTQTRWGRGLWVGYHD